jgi:hypothetical protein
VRIRVGEYTWVKSIEFNKSSALFAVEVCLRSEVMESTIHERFSSGVATQFFEFSSIALHSKTYVFGVHWQSIAHHSDTVPNALTSIV